MAKGYTNGKGLHIEQSGVHTIPGYALRTNPNYTDKVEIYTEVGKQRWIWSGVTYVHMYGSGSDWRKHTERVYTQKGNMGNPKTGYTQKGNLGNARRTEGGSYTKGYHANTGAPPLCIP